MNYFSSPVVSQIARRCWRCWSSPRYSFGACSVRLELLAWGEKGVGAESHCPVWAHSRLPVPSLRLEDGAVLPSNGAWGWRNGRCQRPTRFTEVRCCVDSCKVSPKQQGLGPGRTVGTGQRFVLPMAGWYSSEWRVVVVEICTALRAYK